MPEQSKPQSLLSPSWSEGDRVGILAAELSWCLGKPSWTAALNHQVASVYMSAVAKVQSLTPQTASNTATFLEVGKKKERKIKDFKS